MFIGVVHDNSDMARVKKLASALLKKDISSAKCTGSIAIERFMSVEADTTLYPMHLTCYYADVVDEIDSMALIMATEFFGNMKDEFTRAMANREINTRIAKIDAQKDGTLKAYFAQFREPEDIYWNFLAFISLTSDGVADTAIGTVELGDEVCSLVHYTDSLIIKSYIRGFDAGMNQRKVDELASDPAFKNVVIFTPKK